MLDACLRHDTITSIVRLPLRVDKSKRCHSEIGFCCEACGAWLRCLDEGERGWMCSKKCRRVAARRGTEELEKLLAGSGREAVRRMAHDVSVNAIGEVEPNGASPGIRIGNVV